MAKKYFSPAILNLDGGGDEEIEFGASQGTSGEDSQFIWDPAISAADIDLFWASYDETDLAGMDTNGDLYISLEEFEAWLDSIGGW